MAVTHEITAITGKYIDASGAEKNRYTRLGVVMQTKNGLMLKIEAIPVGWDGWAYLNEPRQDDKPRQPARRGRDDDQVPF